MLDYLLTDILRPKTTRHLYANACALQADIMIRLQYSDSGSYATHPVPTDRKSAVLVRNNKEAKEIFHGNMAAHRDCMLSSGNGDPLTNRMVLEDDLKFFDTKGMHGSRTRLIR